MKLRKQFRLVLLVLMLSLVAAACGGGNQPATTDNSAPTEQQSSQQPAQENTGSAESTTYKVVTHAEFPPFEYLDTSGKPVGFEMDLINEMGKELGWNIEIVNTSWDGVFENIENGKAQLAIAGITITDERKKKYLFSEPYFEAKQLILVPENSPVKELNDVKELNLKVGVMSSTTGALIVQDLLGKTSANIKQYEEMPSMVEDLYNKRVDVVVADDAFLKEHLSKHPKQGYVIIEDPAIPVEHYGIMVKQGETELMDKINEALKKVKESGKYDEIYKQYFVE